MPDGGGDPTCGGALLRDNHVRFADFFLVDADPDYNQVGGFLQWGEPLDGFSKQLIHELIIYASNSTNSRRIRKIRRDSIDFGRSGQASVEEFSTVVFEDTQLNRIYESRAANVTNYFALNRWPNPVIDKLGKSLGLTPVPGDDSPLYSGEVVLGREVGDTDPQNPHRIFIIFSLAY